MFGDVLFLIIGKSGSGKTYACNELEKTGEYKQVWSRTTRKPRHDLERGHKFVDRKQAENELPNALAKTFYDNCIYYVLNEDIKKCNLYVIDEAGADELYEKYTDKLIVSIYLDVKLVNRVVNMRKRGDSIKHIIKRLWADKGKMQIKKNGLVFYDADTLVDFFVNATDELDFLIDILSMIQD